MLLQGAPAAAEHAVLAGADPCGERRFGEEYPFDPLLRHLPAERKYSLIFYGVLGRGGAVGGTVPGAAGPSVPSPWRAEVHFPRLAGSP